MDAFIETPRLDDNISFGSSGGPTFKTYIFEGDSGIEGSVDAWSKVKARYDLQYAIRDIDDFVAVRNMFYNCRGRARGFRFKDPVDFIAIDEPCSGTVNGVNTTFKLQKQYVAGSTTFERRIVKPVSGTISVKKNGIVQGTASVDTTTGIVTFLTAPSGGDVITASFEFDIPVRFDTDAMPVSHEGHELLTWGSLPLVEIIYED